MTIAHEELNSDAKVPEARLIPTAARPRYVPVTDLWWLEPLRQRHEERAARLAVAVAVPDCTRTDHAVALALWGEQVRAAARSASEPPPWSARLSDSWLAGLIDVAEAEIAELVAEVLQVLADCNAAFEEHAGELDALGLYLDGYESLLRAKEAELSGGAIAAPPAAPTWKVPVTQWRARVTADVQDLENYTRRRASRRPTEEQR